MNHLRMHLNENSVSRIKIKRIFSNHFKYVVPLKTYLFVFFEVGCPWSMGEHLNTRYRIDNKKITYNIVFSFFFISFSMMPSKLEVSFIQFLTDTRLNWSKAIQMPNRYENVKGKFEWLLKIGKQIDKVDKKKSM